MRVIIPLNKLNLNYRNFIVNSDSDLAGKTEEQGTERDTRDTQTVRQTEGRQHQDGPHPICSMSSLAWVMMLAPVKHTMPAISMEYQRALMETQTHRQLNLIHTNH